METPQTNGDVLPDRDRLDLRVDGKYYRRKNESESEISTRVPGVSCRSSVCAPSSCNVRLCLPGIMDSEGRVDGSRLRTYIFKNVSLEEACQWCGQFQNKDGDWILCDGCQRWQHRVCTGMTKSQFKHITNVKWYCTACEEESSL